MSFKTLGIMTRDFMYPISCLIFCPNTLKYSLNTQEIASWRFLGETKPKIVLLVCDGCRTQLLSQVQKENWYGGSACVFCLLYWGRGSIFYYVWLHWPLIPTPPISATHSTRMVFFLTYGLIASGNIQYPTKINPFLLGPTPIAPGILLRLHSDLNTKSKYIHNVCSIGLKYMLWTIKDTEKKD